MSEVGIRPSPGHAGLRLFEAERGADGALQYFKAEVFGPALRACTRVYAAGHEAALADLFDAMARDWRGWKGARDWGSLEGELVLSFTADGKGHVAIAVRLRESLHADAWELRARARAEAGDLDDLARAVREFFRGSK